MALSTPKARCPTSALTPRPRRPERRLDAFREAMSVMYDVQPLDETARQAPAIVDSWQLGSSVLIAAQMPAYSYERSSHMIARDGRDLYQIQLYQAGHCHVVRGAPEALAKPGDIMVTDLATPIFTEEPAFRHIDLPAAAGPAFAAARRPRCARRAHPVGSQSAGRALGQSPGEPASAGLAHSAGAGHGCPDRDGAVGSERHKWRQR